MVGVACDTWSVASSVWQIRHTEVRSTQRLAMGTAAAICNVCRRCASALCDRFAVALSAQKGRIACEGDKTHGQCNIPADIGKVKKIAAGYGHTIAIRDFSTPFTDGAFDDSTSDKGTCPYGRGDLNADGFIDAADLSTLFALWGATDAEIGDLSGNGIVDGDDLTQLLSNWNAPEV